MRLIVQIIDVHRKVIKTVFTLLVIKLFMNFLGQASYEGAGICIVFERMANLAFLAGLYSHAFCLLFLGLELFAGMAIVV